MPKAKGEAHGLSKLTEIQVREIRASRAMIKVIAYEYGLTRQTVRVIRKRETWKHV
jgi:hypothetical protein